MTTPQRFSTGIPALDELLGGGLVPGTLTVVMGATGIGKTQLGVQFARAGITGLEDGKYQGAHAPRSPSRRAVLRGKQ